MKQRRVQRGWAFLDCVDLILRILVLGGRANEQQRRQRDTHRRIRTFDEDAGFLRAAKFHYQPLDAILPDQQRIAGQQAGVKGHFRGQRQCDLLRVYGVFGHGVAVAFAQQHAVAVELKRQTRQFL